MLRTLQLMCVYACLVPLFLDCRKVAAQSQPSPSVIREALSKLAKMVGRWEGEATIQLGPGQTVKVKQSEHVQFKLDGGVLLIEGIGREPIANGQEKIVFRALAVCTFDPNTKSYSMHAFRDNGLSKVCSVELTESGMVWGFADARGGRIRYTINLSDDTWSEVGEYIMDGQPTRQIFEMKVRRVVDNSKESH
jgi:hypothetical protein